LRRHVTVPLEAFDPVHPDHEAWVARTGLCYASASADHGHMLQRVNRRLGGVWTPEEITDLYQKAKERLAEPD
jgi:hypothetical protein